MIGAPVEFTPDEQELITQIAGDPPTEAGCWGNENLNPIRAKIKQFYIGEQAETCCYCDMEYPSHHGWVWTVEHVISQTLKPKWIFEPRNLAAACVECNGAKGNSEVRRQPNLVNFPDQGGRYKIIHPHFDNWNDHLLRIGRTYAALDAKGAFTVVCCNLYRFAERRLERQNPIRDKRFDDSIDRLYFANSLDDAEPDIALIRAVIQRAKGEGAAPDEGGGESEA